MTSDTIFISYRREDTAGHAGRLFDRLAAHFGPQRIFMDIDTIKPGVDFVTVIDNAVASCAVLLALIGHDWLTIADHAGKRRLDDPHDFNRVEIESGLKEATTVIPVLVQGTAMPAAEELPSALSELARRNAIELSDARWDYDVQRLISTIEEIIGKPAPAPEVRGRRLLPWLVAGGAAVVAVIVAVVVLHGGPAACGGIAAHTGSLANSDIAFLSDRDNNAEIYGARAGGFRITRFTNDGIDDLRPDWSPNGQELAFGSGSGHHAICIMNADRSQAQLVSAIPGDEEAPDWSPDASKIVFSSGSKAHSNIFVMPADGSGQATNLTKDANRNRSPDWSSTNKIVFSSNAGGSPDIFVMGVDGSRPQQLTHGRASDGAPAWSPDASQIAFPRKQGGQSHIFVMNADGSSLHQVTFGAVVDTSPSWSPSGASLAFSRGEGNAKLDVFVLRLGQGSPRKLNLGPGNNFDPAWRP